MTKSIMNVGVDTHAILKQLILDAKGEYAYEASVIMVILAKIAERAIELSDEELLQYCETLGLLQKL